MQAFSFHVNLGCSLAPVLKMGIVVFMSAEHYLAAQKALDCFVTVSSPFHTAFCSERKQKQNSGRKQQQINGTNEIKVEGQRVLCQHVPVLVI